MLSDFRTFIGYGDMGKRSHTMNRCGYRDEEFFFSQGFKFPFMRRGACGFRGWRSLRDGASSEWKAKWWKVFHAEQAEYW
jgi:hypothetical protein